MEQTALLAASLGAMLLTAASGLVIIPALRRLHFGQTIKEIGPTWHQGKNGTPTMGGLTFYFGSLFGAVLGYTLLAVTMPELTEGLFSPQSVQLIISVLTAYAFGVVWVWKPDIRLLGKFLSQRHFWFRCRLTEH